MPRTRRQPRRGSKSNQERAHSARGGRHDRSGQGGCSLVTIDGPGRVQSRKPRAHAEKLKPVAEAAVGSVRDTLKEQGLPAGGSVTFVQARTAHEIAKAHLARLRLQRMKGELIDRARTTAMVFRLAREERDTWINWPARVAALMASELGVEAHSMQKALETHVRAHFAELAEVKPEFR